MAQSRTYLAALGPKPGIIHMLGAPGQQNTRSTTRLLCEVTMLRGVRTKLVRLDMFAVNRQVTNLADLWIPPEI